MRIFEFSDYKVFLRKRIALMPNKGRGVLTRIAEHLGLHTTMISHVVKGSAHFSLEQSLKLAEFLALNSLETDYLVALVQLERAGDKRAKEFCRTKVEEIRNRALNLKARLGTRNELSEQDRGRYYSTWIYSYLRLLTAIDRFQTIEALATELRLPVSKVRDALDFLISHGLVIEEKGLFKYGNVSTYIESSSALVARHHLNWRQKTQERFDNVRAEDLVFTYPVALSAADFQIVREKIVQLIEEFKAVVGPSPSDDLYCLNIDWLKMS